MEQAVDEDMEQAVDECMDKAMGRIWNSQKVSTAYG
jgi:hypothetical protein